MSSKKLSTLRRHSGFTLVELLVSITVLSIMLLFLGQAMGVISNLWINGIGIVDNYSKARNVMSIMDRDIQAMAMRPDLPAFVDNNSPPNPACAFYTNIQGYDATSEDRNVSLVQYVLSTTGSTAGTLERYNYGMNYPTSTSASTAISPAIPATVTTPTNPNPLSQLTSITAPGKEPLAAGVILFQWQFVDGAGNFSTPTSSAPFPYDYTAPSASSNPRAIVISLLVLNNSAFNLATKQGLITSIQNQFTAGSPSTTQTYSQYWDGILNPSTGTFGSSLPASIRTGFKVFQRYVPLPVAAP
jgi:prepilin-type N-terminal cleavage/methylation domain-containing protein